MKYKITLNSFVYYGICVGNKTHLSNYDIHINNNIRLEDSACISINILELYIRLCDKLDNINMINKVEFINSLKLESVLNNPSIFKSSIKCEEMGVTFNKFMLKKTQENIITEDEMKYFFSNKLEKLSGWSSYEWAQKLIRTNLKGTLETLNLSEDKEIELLSSFNLIRYYTSNDSTIIDMIYEKLTEERNKEYMTVMAILKETKLIDENVRQQIVNYFFNVYK